jgi:hypothetical protein
MNTEKEDGMRTGKWLLLSGALLAALGCKNMMDETASPTGPTALAPAGHENACNHASPRAPWSGDECYDPTTDPDDFAGVDEDNPFFPLVPGTTYHYAGETADGLETNDVFVTGDTKMILGVETRVVHDLVYLEGDLIEETFDWYAQDVDGNVWYFGEDSREIENDVIVSTEGSWEAGMEGARPGIIMLADPKIGTTYRQEFSLDVAEDLARVVSLNRSVSVPYGDFDGCLKTQDWNALEPASQEQKFYCPGIGTVLEIGKRNERVELADVEVVP